MSQNALAEAVERHGVPMGRQGITKIETGRRDSLTVHELFALALALNVSPADLLIPADDSPYDDQGHFTQDRTASVEVELTPGTNEQSPVTAPARSVRQWVGGEDRLPLPDVTAENYEDLLEEFFRAAPAAQRRRRRLMRHPAAQETLEVERTVLDVLDGHRGGLVTDEVHAALVDMAVGSIASLLDQLRYVARERERQTGQNAKARELDALCDLVRDFQKEHDLGRNRMWGEDYPAAGS